jgi:GT2 family glycosyltransferase
MIADIMVVTYNRLELTKKTFNSILETTKTPFNLIIIDNASSDGTQEYLQKFCQEHSTQNFFKGHKLQFNKENMGIAIGRNQALKLSESEWLSTIDNDMLFPENWLGKCIDVLSANPNYGMIGVNVENVDYPIVEKDGLQWQKKSQGNLGAACTVFNRKLHKMIGFFNTEYQKYGEEDSDFGIRIRALGLQMGYIKERGVHLGEGAQDTGEYRKFKDDCRAKNLQKFKQNCADYFSGKKSPFIPFKETLT